MSQDSNKRYKIIGIIFFSLILFINPYFRVRVTHHMLAFSLAFFIIGSCFYFRLLGPGKKATKALNFLDTHEGWWFLIAQAIIFVVFLLIHRDYLSYHLHAAWGDEPSYVDFNFSSWASALGNHRPLGLPVIIKLYQLVFEDFYFWPHVQMICYVFSIFFLYWSFLKFRLNKVLALVVVSLLLWDRSNYHQFLDVQTECFTAVFLHLSIGSMFLALWKWNWKTLIPLVVSVFFLYQVRANFVFVPVLMPLWAVAISCIKEGYLFIRARRVFVRFALATGLPLFLFCLLRWTMVGQFGVASMGGGYLSGHAVHYLNEDNIRYLPEDLKKLATEILRRKRRLSPPNHLSPFEWIKDLPQHEKIRMQAMAFGPDLITAWTVAIKQLKGVEPFHDPKENIDPMKYGRPLSWFHALYYDHETDRLLMRFSKEVLIREWKRFGRWLVGGTFYGMRVFISTRALWLIWLGLLGIGKLFYLLFAQNLDYDRLKRWNQDLGILTMVGASLFVVGFIPTVVFNFPFPRLLDLIGIYLLPVFVCATLPPFWLKKQG